MRSHGYSVEFHALNCIVFTGIVKSVNCWSIWILEGDSRVLICPRVAQVMCPECRIVGVGSAILCLWDVCYWILSE